jgi:hypothetical protein
MYRESVEQIDTEIRQGIPDIRAKLVDEAWFGQSPTKQDPIGSPTTSLEDQTQIEADSGIYEDVWGEAPTAEDVYGASSFDYGDELPEMPDPSDAYEYDADLEPDL